MVNHGHFQVNGKKVDIPSYQVRQGDEITVKERSKEAFPILHSVDTVDRPLPSGSRSTGRAQDHGHTLPSREQIDTQIQEQLVVELYSK